MALPSWKLLVARQEIEEERSRPLGDLVARLTPGTRHVRRVGLPAPTSVQVARFDLVVREALPLAVVHLQQARVGLDLRTRRDARGLGDGFSSLTGPEQRARHDALQRDWPESLGEGGGLASTLIRERHINLLPEVLLGVRPRRQSVAREDERQHRVESIRRRWFRGRAVGQDGGRPTMGECPTEMRIAE